MALVSPANAQLDNNQNGMSDPWERRFNQGNLFDISHSAHQPDADPDGDGFTNLKESITGTNPFQGQTSEGVIRAMVAQTAAGRELKWPVVPGKRYTAQHSATLAAGSWKAVGQPMVAAKGQAEGRLVIPPHLLAGTGFFQVAVRDVDTDEDGLADAEEHLLGTSPLHSYSLHGVGDYWLAKHFTDLGSFDPDAAPHGDGMTYREAYQLNLNPHLLKAVQTRTQASGSGAVLGDEAFINGDFSKPAIGTGVRKEVTNAQWDDWDTTTGWDTGVNGWTAVNGTNIELQKFYIAEGSPYCELQAHPDAHNGLKQTIKVVPGKTYLFTLDYRARANVTSGVQVFADETELTLNDLAEVGGWTPKWATFTKPASSEDESEEKVEVTFKITPPTGGTAGGTGFVKNVRLLPDELAPDKLASNGDFNEGDTGATSAQTTGAKADNRNQTLIAARDSIDGSISAGDLVTEDLHEGWFGLLPDAMPDEFFDGATITITKLDKTDPATGEREEGTVRFFATWGENEEVVIDHNDPFIDSMFPNGSAPKNLVGEVYGANKTIPSGAKFWIEGVSLGEITLEWRYQKGDIDIKHEQSFEIGNDWSKEKWQKAVRDEIYLDSYTTSSGSAMNGSSTQGVDTDQYAVANDFLPNRPYIYSVYEYYAKLHRDEPGKFLWAGLAKQAGAPVYAGLSDAQNGRTGIAIATFGIIDNQTLKTIQDILIQANIDIYNDLSYQFVAYRTGGIDSIEYLAQTQGIEVDSLAAWQKIDNGNDVSEGNQGLLEREQSIILEQTYIDLDDLADGKVSWMFSLLAKNPVPSGPDFQDVVPSGNIAAFDDRWQWITNAGNGMWPLWMGKSEAQRLQFANRVLTSYADTFNLLAPLR